MITLNGHPIPVTFFSDRTSQVWKLPFVVLPQSDIEWKFEHEGELMHLAQLVDLLRENDVETLINLHMPFLPYGRQDKAVSNETTFALHTFAKLLNTIGFDKVTSLDSHNLVNTSFLIDNFKNEFPYFQIQKVVDVVKPDILCFPDKGARERYGKELSFLGKIHIFGEKERDQLTGHITKYTLQDDVTDRNVLIIDDICDGGMTFILLAKVLLTNGAKSVNLYTTHGIYSKGLRPLKEAKISRIFNKDGEVSEYQNHIAIKELT